MEIGKVKFGEYSVSSGQAGMGKKSDEEQGIQNGTSSQGDYVQSADAQDILDALSYAGVQNMAFISKTPGIESVEDAQNLLGEERSSDIEAMMAEFESGVEKIADIIGEEFGTVFSEAQRNALAAEIFAEQE